MARISRLKTAGWRLAWRRAPASQPTFWKATSRPSTSPVVTWPFIEMNLRTSTASTRNFGRRATTWTFAGDFSKPASGSRSPRAPFVWHHRRQGPLAYLKQQAGYGEAEALLLFKHPERFNRRGESKWRGVLYGIGLRGVRLGRSLIYRGMFGSGLFQCLYQPAAAHWATLPTTLEWHLALGATALVALNWPVLWLVVLIMLSLSVMVSGLQMYQARMEKQHDGLLSRLMIFGFSYAQPLVRSFYRYRTRWFYFNPAASASWLSATTSTRFPLTGQRTMLYWSETGRDRMEILQRAVEFLSQHRWGRIVDSGWTVWDLRIYCDPLIYLQIRTTQENHGGNKRLIRIHQRMRLRDFTWLVIAAAVAAVGAVVVNNALAAIILLGVAAVAGLTLWWRCTRLAGKAAALFQHVAEELDMIRCDTNTPTEIQPRLATGDS